MDAQYMAVIRKWTLALRSVLWFGSFCVCWPIWMWFPGWDLAVVMVTQRNCPWSKIQNQFGSQGKANWLAWMNVTTSPDADSLFPTAQTAWMAAIRALADYSSAGDSLARSQLVLACNGNHCFKFWEKPGRLPHSSRAQDPHSKSTPFLLLWQTSPIHHGTCSAE